MDWPTVHRYYRVLFEEAKERGETQHTIAQRGGVTQPDISRLLAMTGRDGPQARTLLGGIRGLGMTPLQFFAEIETRELEARQKKPARSPSSTLQSGKPLQQDATFPSTQEGPADAAPKIEHLAERFARSLVEHVKRGLAEGHRPPPTSRSKKSSRG